MSDYLLNSRRPPPSPRDWVLLTINIAFVVMGLTILPRDRDAGIVTLAFFGSCLGVSAATILRKRRFRSFRAEKVDVAGGVPIRPNATVMRLLGLWLLLLGVVLVVFGHAYPLAFRAISGFVAVAGATLLVAAFTGQWPAGYLQFDPDCLTIAQRGWAARIPWEVIAAVHEAEYETNPMLLIAVRDLARLEIIPPQAHGRAMSAIARMQGIMGAEFSIMTTHYGIDLPVLSATVKRYVQDATARAELRPQLGP